MIIPMQFTHAGTNQTYIYEFPVPFSPDPYLKFFESYGGYGFMSFFGAWMLTAAIIKVSQNSFV